MVASPSTLRIAPSRQLSGSVTPPGAKSGTVRALLCGTLAAGLSTIDNAGSGDNIRAMAAACRVLGAEVTESGSRTWDVRGIDHRLPDVAELDAGNSGIVLRLLTAVGAAMSYCSVGTRFAESLGRRGNGELIGALRGLGADATGQGAEACPPLIVGRGTGLHGGTVRVSGRRSSQFLSGLLFLAPLVGDDITIEVSDKLSSAPMVGTTVAALRRSGIRVTVAADGQSYQVQGGQRFGPARHPVASDASAVAGIMASAAAAPGATVRVSGFHHYDVGTGAMIRHLGEMGVRIGHDGDDLICYGADELVPITIDGSACPDSILPLAALSCFATGTSIFANVETLRYKECDRISDFCRELQAAGAKVEERREAIIIHGTGTIPGGAEVYGHHDHSVVMAMAVVALRSQAGLGIRGWESVGQTYPGFFADLRTLGADVG